MHEDQCNSPINNNQAEDSFDLDFPEGFDGFPMNQTITDQMGNNISNINLEPEQEEEKQGDFPVELNLLPSELNRDSLRNTPSVERNFDIKVDIIVFSDFIYIF